MSQPLVMCAPAPVIDTPGGYRLDVKFVEGMAAHARGWDGPLVCVLWRGARAIPFGREYAPGALGFDLHVLDAGAPVPEALFAGAGVVMVSADMAGVPEIVAAARGAGAPAVMALEYTLETRLQVIALEPGVAPLRRLVRNLRARRADRRLRAMLSQAQGVQFNGYPAFDTYAHGVVHPMMYLDNRLHAKMMATDAEMEARAARLRSGAPLRLVHSGRLEPMKGAQDLLPVMAALAARGVAATLDIFGTGTLEDQIRLALPAFEGRVRLHGPVDFETQLVPFSRTEADVFLSCHRQSDPSCTYIEAMGCGLALAGYDNRMWARLSAEAGLDTPAPMGRPGALAEKIAAWDRNREALITAVDRGLTFARAHDFDTEFDRRMTHLRACAGRGA